MTTSKPVDGLLSRQHPLYKTWNSMRNRCLNPRNWNYLGWGGRGITVCERWKSFENFCQDMGPRPRGMSLDRIDNDGPYAPSNCRWANAKTQSTNSRKANFLEINGERHTVSEWARKLGISRSTVRERYVKKRVHKSWRERVAWREKRASAHQSEAEQ